MIYGTKCTIAAFDLCNHEEMMVLTHDLVVVDQRAVRNKVLTKVWLREALEGLGCEMQLFRHAEAVYKCVMRQGTSSGVMRDLHGAEVV